MAEGVRRLGCFSKMPFLEGKIWKIVALCMDD
jgi:hypothetical protein